MKASADAIDSLYLEYPKYRQLMDKFNVQSLPLLPLSSPPDP